MIKNILSIGSCAMLCHCFGMDLAQTPEHLNRRNALSAISKRGCPLLAKFIFVF
jgi:hypothetical protein